MSVHSRIYVSVILSVCVLSGCLTPRQSSPIANYDLGQPQQTGLKLNIGNIDQSGSYNSKMTFRISPEKIDIREYQRWTRSPDLVLNDYLKGSFTPGGPYTIEGEILAFENDLTTESAVMSFYYKINKAGIAVSEGLFQKTEPSSQSADDYAAAMAKMTRLLIDEISGKLKTLPK